MAGPHFVVRRSRMGRFNFTLLTSSGRLTGSVTVPVEGRSNDELRHQAMEQIRALAEDFARVQDVEVSIEAEEPQARTAHGALDD